MNAACGADDDLEAELEALEQDDLNEKLSAIESTAGLASPSKAPASAAAASPAIKSPAVPQSDPHDEAAQLAALEAEMAVWSLAFITIKLILMVNVRKIVDESKIGCRYVYWCALLYVRPLFLDDGGDTQHFVEFASV